MTSNLVLNQLLLIYVVTNFFMASVNQLYLHVDVCSSKSLQNIFNKVLTYEISRSTRPLEDALTPEVSLSKRSPIYFLMLFLTKRKDNF